MSNFLFCLWKEFLCCVCHWKKKDRIKKWHKPNILCMYVMNGFINMQPVYTIKIYSSASSVSMERKMTWKNGREKIRKMRNNWKWFCLGGARLVAYPSQHFIQLFRHDFEKTDYTIIKKKSKPNLHSWHLIFFYIFFVALVLFANFVWPLHEFDHLPGYDKKNTHLLSIIKWFDSPFLNEWKILSFKRRKLKREKNTRD